MTQRTVHINVEGISDDEARARPAFGGNSMNWVTGHIVTTRSRLLPRFGEEALFPDDIAAQYRRGSDGDVKNPLTMRELLDAYNRSLPMFVSALQRLTDEQLSSPAPFPSPAGPDATLAQALNAFVFHEGYHCGQLGLLRRVLGKRGAIA